jgi:hypothetical protein
MIPFPFFPTLSTTAPTPPFGGANPQFWFKFDAATASTNTSLKNTVVNGYFSRAFNFRNTTTSTLDLVATGGSGTFSRYVGGTQPYTSVTGQVRTATVTGAATPLYKGNYMIVMQSDLSTGYPLSNYKSVLNHNNNAGGSSIGFGFSKIGANHAISFGDPGGDVGSLWGSNINLGQKYLISGRIDDITGVFSARVNGVAVGTQSISGGVSGSGIFKMFDCGPLSGVSVMEVVIYNGSTLTDEDMILWENYLISKWSVSSGIIL